ncbi:MAG TPA: glycerol-3-phosphate acyltransferase [Caldisericia bacterium]|nr:glycerol-3-phosphate acyltransferase [Caldisericia bacterium]HPF48940.1 glycerol-3-phosphate acyltransferase [Caldisericia bacterium]HPI83196.1 glycerol-3-phosphate acyltransferase [Caldisericia bacterium]HPQ92423.1 glycerol-3-phosphate acyltransferase [Caldisericia bacterium]HRV74479.1 glycerol-3-phosphate acyltransferase [Caldisericia bacterium]
MSFPLLVLGSYLFGSIPSGFIVGRLFGGVDVQTVGTKQIGTANVTRQLGKIHGILCLSLDLLKALIPMSITHYFLNEPMWVTAICGMVTVFGHDFPVFLNFDGGGGLATSMAVLFFLSPLHFFVVAPFALATSLFTGYVTVGGVVQFWGLGVAAWATGAPMATVYTSITLTIMAFLKSIPWIVNNPPGKFMNSHFVASPSDPVTPADMPEE